MLCSLLVESVGEAFCDLVVVVHEPCGRTGAGSRERKSGGGGVLEDGAARDCAEDLAVEHLLESGSVVCVFAACSLVR